MPAEHRGHDQQRGQDRQQPPLSYCTSISIAARQQVAASPVIADTPDQATASHPSWTPWPIDQVRGRTPAAPATPPRRRCRPPSPGTESCRNSGTHGSADRQHPESRRGGRAGDAERGRDHRGERRRRRAVAGERAEARQQLVRTVARARDSRLRTAASLQAEQGGDLLRALALAVIQQQHFAAVVGQRRDQSRPRRVRARARSAARPGTGPGSATAAITSSASATSRRDAASAAQVVMGEIAGDLAQPWQEAGRVLQAPQVLPRVEECLLGNVLAGRHVAHDRQRQAVTVFWHAATIREYACGSPSAAAGSSWWIRPSMVSAFMGGPARACGGNCLTGRRTAANVTGWAPRRAQRSGRHVLDHRTTCQVSPTRRTSRVL